MALVGDRGEIESFKRKYFGGDIFSNSDFSSEVVESSPKIVINSPGTYERLFCKGEPDRFSGYRDSSVQTHRQTDRNPVTLL